VGLVKGCQAVHAEFLGWKRGDGKRCVFCNSRGSGGIKRNDCSSTIFNGVADQQRNKLLFFCCFHCVFM